MSQSKLQLALMKKKLEERKGKAGHFNPLVSDASKLKPTNELFLGNEIEKRFVLLTKEEDHTPKGNGLETLDKVLKHGLLVEQGYILDLQKARKMVTELGIKIQFEPTTVRLRKMAGFYILTLKDRKSTKAREAEWQLDQNTFNKYWKLTKGARISKKRYIQSIKGHYVEIDAFLDRLLLMAEIEVDSEKEMSKLPKLGMDVTGNKNWSNKSMSQSKPE